MLTWKVQCAAHILIRVNFDTNSPFFSLRSTEAPEIVQELNSYKVINPICVTLNSLAEDPTFSPALHESIFRERVRDQASAS